MKDGLVAPLLALALTLTSAPQARAQTAPTAPQPAAAPAAQDWQRLKDLKRGARVWVETRGGEIEAKFVGVSGDRLTLSEGGDTYEVEQREIIRAYRLKGRWSRDRTIAVGLGVGLVAGSFVGAALMVGAERRPGHVPSADDTGPLAAGAALGALTGAVLGALVGGKRKGELLYEAK